VSKSTNTAIKKSKNLLLTRKISFTLVVVAKTRTNTTKNKKGTKRNAGATGKGTKKMNLVSQTGLRYETTKIRVT